MKKYYYILVFALSLFISACNQSPIEEGISGNIEKDQKEAHYSFDMNVGFGGAKLDDPSLVNDLRSLSYNIDGSTWAIEGRGKLPEKDLNAIVSIIDEKGVILSMGNLVFKKVPGKNQFSCENINLQLDNSNMKDIKIENDSIKYIYKKYRENISYSNWHKIYNYYDASEKKTTKNLYVNAIFTYRAFDEIMEKLTLRRTQYRFQYKLEDNPIILDTKKPNNYNIDVPFVMDALKIEAKNGKLKIADGEKPVIKPLGSLLFIKINNKASFPITYSIDKYHSKEYLSVLSLGDIIRIQGEVEYRDINKDRYFSFIPPFAYIEHSRQRDMGIVYNRSKSFKSYGYLLEGQSTDSFLCYFIPYSYKRLNNDRKIEVLIRSVRYRETLVNNWGTTIWRTKHPISNGTIYKADIDIYTRTRPDFNG